MIDERNIPEFDADLRTIGVVLTESAQIAVRLSNGTCGECLCCGKIFSLEGGSHKRKLCSPECSGKHYSEVCRTRRRIMLDEIAEKINVHLKRFEADPKINSDIDTKPYYNAVARRAGAYLSLVYISYQDSSNLRPSDAKKYLAWLDAGNVGRHFEALR